MTIKIPRIAANTLVTYGKSVAVMAFGFFTSRWVLMALGQSDYGIYGLVGSVVTVVTFLQIVLSNSISRFYAVSADADLHSWFAASIKLQGALALLVAVVGWPVGEFAIGHWLDVPPDRLAAGLWVFRAAIFAAVVGIATVPWSALFMARQRFGEPAAYDVVQAVVACLFANWLVSARGDRLLLFAAVMAAIAIVRSLAVVVRAQMRFRMRLSFGGGGSRRMGRQLVRYAACRLLGITGWLVQHQGGAFVVNVSLGVRANAAYAIASQFAIHAGSLVGALATALTPALAQATGSKDRGSVNRLTMRSCVCSGALALLLGVPLMLETEGVLRVWLVNPPDGVAALAFAFTAAMMADASTTGIVAALSAVRDIGRWQAFECIALSLTCPVAWLLFRHGFGLTGLGVTFFGTACVMMVGRLAFARRLIGFPVRDWLESVAAPLLVVGSAAVGGGLAVRFLMAPGLVRMVCVGLASSAVLCTWVMRLRRRMKDEPIRVGRRQAGCASRNEQAAESSIPCAPLVIFAFKRIDTLSRVLDSLARCENLTGNGARFGYAFLDGARNARDEEGVRQVREAMETFRREHFPNLQIVVRKRNLGNSVNIPTGITEVVDRHGRAIVVEDDVVVSKYFLSYMDEALERYEANPKIWCVHACRIGLVRVPRCYPHDVYLTPRCVCWGWGTWKDRWSAVDFEMRGWPAFKSKPENLSRLDEVGVELRKMLEEQYAGVLKTWDVQCALHMFEHNLWAIEPRLALTKNIGFGTDCDHCKQRNVLMETAKYYDFRPRLTDELTPEPAIYGQYRHVAHYTRLRTRIWRLILRIWVQI